MSHEPIVAAWPADSPDAEPALVVGGDEKNVRAILIAADYIAGKRIEDILASRQCELWDLYRILAKFGVPKRVRPTARKDEIAAAYASGMKLDLILEEYKCSMWNLYRVLDQFGIPRRDRKRSIAIKAAKERASGMALA